MKILVISDSLQDLPKAVDRLDASGHSVSYVDGLIPFDQIAKELSDADDTVFDCGAVTTALVNAAWSRGLGCVINGQGIMQSPVVREVAEIPEDQVILTCVALGWPDASFVANDVKSRRRSVEETARFIGF